MNIQLWTDLSQLKNKGAYNLPLMKISAWHKTKGDEVAWHNSLIPCDLLYCSKIFSDEWTQGNLYTQNAKEVIKGGTGYNLETKLPDEIEHIYPDYSLYPFLKNTAVGFMTRGCPNNCDFCICSKKEGRQSCKVADINEFWRGQKKIELFDPNVLACRDRAEIFRQLAATGAEITFKQGLDARFVNDEAVDLLKSCKIKQFYFAWDLEKFSEPIERGLLKVRAAYSDWDYRKFTVYMLVNFDTSWEFDIKRVTWLKEHGFNPYVMIYEKWKCHPKYKHLQRAVNNKFIFSSSGIRDYEPLKKFL